MLRPEAEEKVISSCFLLLIRLLLRADWWLIRQQEEKFETNPLGPTSITQVQLTLKVLFLPFSCCEIGAESTRSQDVLSTPAFLNDFRRFLEEIFCAQGLSFLESLDQWRDIDPKVQEDEEVVVHLVLIFASSFSCSRPIRVDSFDSPESSTKHTSTQGRK